jgi:preprotein translocase subunit SecG
MTVLISVLLIIVCILLILVVLIQNPKGGGLSSAFAGSNQFMGVRKTADFLEKATWTLAIALVVLSLFSAMVQTPEIGPARESEIEGQIQDAPLPAAPALPQDIPAAPQEDPVE